MSTNTLVLESAPEDVFDLDIREVGEIGATGSADPAVTSFDTCVASLCTATCLTCPFICGRIG
ncbi:hypothetical protein [Streptomyces sp. NPDC053048]|uniref:hypothetical protein n=1 Tax=Streptomyces sp. NPDC053048 TaxID=3365694 RepID=UPI0037CD0513